MFQGWSFIYDYGSAPRELYDLQNDPGEKRNVFKENGIVARKLQRALEEKIKGSVALSKKIIPNDVKIDDKVKETLKSLGYIK